MSEAPPPNSAEKDVRRRRNRSLGRFSEGDDAVKRSEPNVSARRSFYQAEPFFREHRDPGQANRLEGAPLPHRADVQPRRRHRHGRRRHHTRYEREDGPFRDANVERSGDGEPPRQRRRTRSRYTTAGVSERRSHRSPQKHGTNFGKASTTRKKSVVLDHAQDKMMARMYKGRTRHASLGDSRTPGTMQMTTGQIALIEKKQKLYKETQPLLLWGIRKVTINPSNKDDLMRFPDNSITLSRYKWYTFLPKCCIQQFHRLPNIWFLLVCILQAVTGSTMGFGAWATALPLVVLLCVAGAKDLWEDRRRHQNDQKQNSRRAFIVVSSDPPYLRETEWCKIRVGNILYLVEDEEVPADIVILSSSNVDGLAHVDTVDLNGQADLKAKFAVKETRAAVTLTAIGSVRGRVVCEQPTIVLDTFSGSLKLDAHPRAAALNVSNFILRGSKIRNTDFVFGVVVYTGKDTRIHCNTLAPSAKYNVVDYAINRYILVMLFIIVLSSLVSLLIYYKYEPYKTFRDVAEGFDSSSDQENIFEMIIVFFILLNNLIPISLLVTIDIVRFLQGLLIESDETMATIRPRKTEAALTVSEMRNANLNETLGMVDFVFTDKTGTLTQNGMLFRMCSIGGRIYGWERRNRKTAVVSTPRTLFPASTSSSRDRAGSQLESDFQGSVKDVYSSFVITDNEENADDNDEQESRLEGTVCRRRLDLHRGSTASGITADHRLSSRRDHRIGSASSRRTSLGETLRTASQDLVQEDVGQVELCEDFGSFSSAAQTVKSGVSRIAARPPGRRRASSSHKQVTFHERESVGLSERPLVTRYHRHRTRARRPSHASVDASRFRSDASTGVSRPGSNQSGTLSFASNESGLDSTCNAEYGVQSNSVAPLYVAEAMHQAAYEQSLSSVVRSAPPILKQRSIGENNQDTVPVHALRMTSLFQHTIPAADYRTLFQLPSLEKSFSSRGVSLQYGSDSGSKKSVFSARLSSSPSAYLSEDNGEESTLFQRPYATTGSVAATSRSETIMSEENASSETDVDDLREGDSMRSGLEPDRPSEEYGEKYHYPEDFCPLAAKGRCLFNDKKIFRDLNAGSWRSRKIDEFIKVMALCNTVIPYVLLPNGSGPQKLSVASSATTPKSLVRSSGGISAGSGRRLGTKRSSSHRTEGGKQDIQSPVSNSSGGASWRSQPRGCSGLVGRLCHKTSIKRTHSRLRSVDSAQNLPDTVTTASTEKKESVRAAAAELHSGRRGSWASPHNHQILTQRRRTIQPVGSSPVSVFPNGAVNSAHGPTNSDPQMGALLTFMRGTPRPTGGKAGVSPEDFYPEHARKMTPHTPRHEKVQREQRYGSITPVAGRAAGAPYHGFVTAVSGSQGGGASGDVNEAKREPQTRGKLFGSILRRRTRQSSYKSGGAGYRGTADSSSQQPQRVLNFFRSSVWDGSLRDSISYQAYSPDEECLVYAASYLGYTLVSKTVSHIYLEIGETLQRFEFLGVNAWTSNRKRMSIVVKPEGEEHAVLYCKGADETMLPLLDEEPEDIAQLQRQIERFSLRGLRSLVVACRYLTKWQAETFRRLYMDACTSIYNKNERAEMVANEFEQNLELLGITGVRDKLQPGVPDVVEMLTEAGARIWMLTGDSSDYSIHVGFKPGTPVRGSRAKKEGFALFEQFRAMRLSCRASQGLCLVITGHSIPIYLRHQELQSVFLLMTCSSDTVLCTRVTPAQKAQLVEVMKKRLTPSPVTLAIGDGASDVSMLQAAHCGVAVHGSQGMEAVAACDFALPRFSDLRRLLFVHGRLNYLRISLLTLWFFFKSVLLVMPLLFYGPMCMFTATFFYDSPMYIAFNLIFTSLPIIVTAVTQWDVPECVCEHVPILYALGRRRLYFNAWVFGLWLCEAVCWSLVCFSIVLGVMGSSPLSANGDGTLDVLGFGYAVYSTVTLCANVKLLLCCTTFTRLWIAIFSITVLLQFPAGVFRNYVWFPNGVLAEIPIRLKQTPAFWLSLLLCTVAGGLLHTAFLGLRYLMFSGVAEDVRRLTRRLHAEAAATKKLETRGDEAAPSNGLKKIITARHEQVTGDTGNSCYPQRLSPRSAQILREHYNPFVHPNWIYQLPEPRHFQLTDNVLSCAPFLAGSSSSAKSPRPQARTPASGMHSVRRRLQTLGMRITARVGLSGRIESATEAPAFPTDWRQHAPEGEDEDVSCIGFGDSVLGEDLSLASSSRSDSLLFVGANGEDVNDLTARKRRANAVKVSDLIRRFSLKFKDQQLEAEFQVTRHKEYYKYRAWYTFVLVSLLVAYLFQISADLYNFRTFTSWQKWVGVSLISATLLGSIVWSFMDSFYAYVERILIAILLALTTGYLLSTFDKKDVPIGILCIFGTVSFVILRISFTYAVLVNAIFFVAFVVGYLIYPVALNFFLLILPHVLGIQGFTGFAGYRLEYNQRKRFLLNYQVEVSRRKQREILNTMLPPFVVEKMLNATLTKDGIPVDLKAEDRGTVTVVFCDVYDFQNIVRTVEPTRLVEVLDSLFLCFDKCAEQFGCTKVETVFETYLSAAGLRPGQDVASADEDSLNVSRKDAFDALDMALAMLEVASFIKYELDVTKPQEVIADAANSAPISSSTEPAGQRTAVSTHAMSPSLSRGSPADAVTARGVSSADNPAVGPRPTTSRASVNHGNSNNSLLTGGPARRPIIEHETRRIRVKLGIHSGRVISGVVGAKKPQYALFGDTVNTASRMKLTGEPDMIHVSDATYRLVECDPTLSWIARVLEVKGKGMMTTYLLSQVTQSKYPDFGNDADSPTAAQWQHRLHEEDLPISGTHRPSMFVPGSEMSPLRTSRVVDRRPSRMLPPANSFVVQQPGVTRATSKEPIGPLGASTQHVEKTDNNTVDSSAQRQQSSDQHSDGVNSFRSWSMEQQALQDTLDLDHSKRRELLYNVPLHQSEMLAPTPRKAEGAQSSVPSRTVSISSSSLESKAVRFTPPLLSSVELSAKPSSESVGLVPQESSFHRRGRIQSAIFNVQRSMRRVSVFRPSESAGDSKAPVSAKSSEIVSRQTCGQLRSSKYAATDDDERERHEANKTPPNDASRRSQRGGDKTRARLKWLGDSGKGASKNLRKTFLMGRDRSAVVTSEPTAANNVTPGAAGVDHSALEADVIIVGDTETDPLSFEPRATKLQSYLVTLSFRNREQEEEYKHFFYNNKSNINTIEQSLIIFLVAFVLYTIMEIVFNGHRRTLALHQYFELRDVNQFWAVRAVYTGIWFIAWIFFHYRARPEIQTIIGVRWMTFVLNATFISATCIFLIMGAWAFSFSPMELEWLETDTLQLVFFITIMHHNTGLLFQHVILVDTLLVAMVFVFIHIVCSRTPAAISMMFLICPILFFNGLSAHHKENIDRLTWFVSEEMQTTEDRARELLNDMLPKQVLEEFQQDKLKLAYRHDRMTFLFADICGFTVYANSVDATEVVQMLQQLFACFDRDSTRFGLFKLCTIGDAYVAVSEPVTEDNPDWNPVEGAERVLEMANAMIEKIREVRERLNIPGLNMRIGLHYGKCVGGVIGSGRLRYDLWGLDVLTGNLMESNGVAGKINVSEVLKQFLEEQFPDRFRFKFNRAVTVIDRVVNSFLLHDGTEDEEEKNSAEARTSVAGVRKGKRRFSVLGMRFGGKDDENKKEHHVGSGTVMSQQFGFIGPQDNVMSGAMISGVGQKDGPAGTANVVRIGARRGSIARFFGKKEEEPIRNVPPQDIQDAGATVNTHTSDASLVPSSLTGKSNGLTLDKLREMFHNAQLAGHSTDDSGSLAQPQSPMT